MILVTAPTSNIGRRVLARLVQAGHAVRVIVRDPVKIPDQIRQNVEVVQGSHGDAKVVDRAFAGADDIFWLAPPNPTANSVTDAYRGFTEPAAQAIKANGVKRIVSITALGRGTPMADRAGFVMASHQMDDLLAATGASFRAITNPSFMDNIGRQAQPIKDKGMFFGPIDGDRKMPFCAVRDIADQSSAALLESNWSGMDHVAVLGPEDISFNDMARIMSEVLARPVRYQQISFGDYKAGFVKMGMSDAMAQGMTDMAAAKNDGLDNVEPRMSKNTTPTTFRQWCEEELKPVVYSVDQLQAKPHE